MPNKWKFIPEALSKEIEKNKADFEDGFEFSLKY